MRNRAIAVAGVAVTGVLLAWVLKDVSLTDVWEKARSAHPGWILAAVVLSTSTFGLRIFRWRLMLRSDGGGEIPPAPLWHAIAVGFMANNLLPFRAGELMRAFTIHRLAGVRVSSALSSLILERLLDAITAIALLFIGLLSAGIPSEVTIAGFRLADLATRTAILCGILLAACIAALVFPGLAKRIVDRLIPSARLADKLKAVIDGIRGGLGALASPSRVVAAVAWSFVIWLVNGLSFYVGFRAFDIPVGFGGALILQTFILIGIAAPSTPGYFGPFEAAIRAVLGIFGVPAEIAVSYGLTYHFTTFLPITLLGLWSLTTTGISLKEARREAAAPAPAPTGE